MTVLWTIYAVMNSKREFTCLAIRGALLQQGYALEQKSLYYSLQDLRKRYGVPLVCLNTSRIKAVDLWRVERI